MTPQSFKRVPGLLLFRDALDLSAQRRVAAKALALHDHLKSSLGENNGKLQTTHVPQAIKSESHNLSGERHFYRLRFPDKDRVNGVVACEHFPEYGNLHHSLTYFQRNQSIPEFAKQELIVPLLSHLPAVVEAADGLGKSVDALEWRMTMNVYELQSQATPEPLFPYHVDIEQNGRVTAIFTLLTDGCIQFAAPADQLSQQPAFASEEHPETVVLAPGSMLVAAGGALNSLAMLYPLLPLSV
jgi:hypothetical protein